MGDHHISMIDISKSIYTTICSQLNATPLMVVGEVHGVKNNIEFYTQLIKTFGFSTFAIELPKSFSGLLNTTVKYPPDGRFSKEIIDFIKQSEVKVIYFDNEVDKTTTWNKRDEDMAENFLAEFDQTQKTLLIAGNYHTQTKPIINNKGETLYPLGLHLRNKLGNFPVCTIRYLNGQFYNFGLQDFVDISDKNVPNTISQTSEYDFEYTIKNAEPITLI